MRIAFAGGGTGGHVFPIQSLIKYIDKKLPGQHTFFWLGEKPSLEYETFKTLRTNVRGLHFLPITSGKWRREKEFKAILKNLFDLLKLGVGFFMALFWLLRTKTDVVFCKGGYVSLPVVVAGWILRKRIFMHESDTTPGLSNRLCSKFTSVIFTGFPGVFPGKEMIVGQILDDDLCSGSETVESDSITHMLVTGGSQGSESVYMAIKKILDTHSFPSTYFHVILGTKNSQLTAAFVSHPNVSVYSFVDQKMMGGLLQRCDVSVTRGGTTSLAEQDLFGMKKIIIPIPWTHDQYKNAMYYKNNCGDILVKQDDDAFQSTLQNAILEQSTYKKGSYPDPLHSIRTTKDTIIDALLKHLHV